MPDDLSSLDLTGAQFSANTGSTAETSDVTGSTDLAELDLSARSFTGGDAPTTLAAPVAPLTSPKSMAGYDAEEQAAMQRELSNRRSVADALAVSDGDWQFSLQAAKGIAPERAAAMADMIKKYNLPFPVVDKNLAELQAHAADTAWLDEFGRNAGEQLKSWAAQNPLNAAALRGNTAMYEVERAVQELHRDAVKGEGSWWDKLGYSFWGAHAQAGGAIPRIGRAAHSAMLDSAENTLAEHGAVAAGEAPYWARWGDYLFGTNMSGQTAKLAAELVERDKKTVKELKHSEFFWKAFAAAPEVNKPALGESFLYDTPGLLWQAPYWLTGAPGMVAMGADMAASSANEMVDAGADRTTALTMGAASGIAQGALEKFQVGRFLRFTGLKSVVGAQGAKQAFIDAGKNMLVEGGTEWGQSVIDSTFQGAGLNWDGVSDLDTAFGKLWDDGVIGGLRDGATVMPLTLLGLPIRLARVRQQSQMVAEDEARHAKIAEAVEASGMAEQNPGALISFYRWADKMLRTKRVEATTPAQQDPAPADIDSPSTTSIPAARILEAYTVEGALHQDALAKDMEEIGLTAEQVIQTAETGGEVAIEDALYYGKQANRKAWAVRSLELGEVRHGNNQTPVEAARRMQEIRAEMAEMFAAAKQTDAAEKAIDEVRARFKPQLQASGIYKDDAEIDKTLDVALALLADKARRQGMDPVEAIQRVELRGAELILRPQEPTPPAPAAEPGQNPQPVAAQSEVQTTPDVPEANFGKMLTDLNNAKSVGEAVDVIGRAITGESAKPEVAKTQSEVATTPAPAVGVKSGEATTISTPAGDYAARYEVVEADSIIASHNAKTFARNPDFPAGVQERNYHSDPELRMAVSIGFNPHKVIGTDPSSTVGTPILNNDTNIVLSGNNRTMRILRQYAENKPEYKSFLADYLRKTQGLYGINPETVARMRQPVLVRRLQETVDPARASVDFNAQEGMSKDAASQAVSRGRFIGKATLELLGDMKDGESLREFSDRKGPELAQALLIDGVLKENELAAYVRSNGSFTPNGKELVEYALMGHAIASEGVDVVDVITGMSEELRRKVIAIAAPIAATARHPDYDLRPVLRDGVRHIVEMKKMPGGGNWQDYAGQQTLFETDLPRHGQAFEFGCALYTATTPTLRDALAGYNSKIPDGGGMQGSMFGDAAYTQPEAFADMMQAAVGTQSEVFFQSAPELPPVRAEEVTIENTDGYGDPRAHQFVLSPDGKVDWGEITPEQSKAIRRQAGGIRLQVGWHGKEGKGFGLLHIQDRGRQVGDDLDLLHSVIRNPSEIRANGGRLIFVGERGIKRTDGVCVELVPGDFYSVITGYGAKNSDLEKKPLLWSREQTPQKSPSPGEVGLFGHRLNNGESEPPVAAPQSNGNKDTLPDDPDSVKDNSALMQPARGMTFIEDSKHIIQLGEGADKSTFLHELSHIWLRDIVKVEQAGEADEQTAQMLASIRQYLGADAGAPFTVEQHETFARSFEAYLMEGRAPSPALASAFASLRKWFINIYRTLRGLNVTLTDDIRQTFDRMLAAEDEITAAEEYYGSKEALIDLYDASEADRKEVALKRQEAQEDTRQHALNIRMKAWKAAQGGMEEIRLTVAEEVEAEPVYKALAYALDKGGISAWEIQRILGKAAVARFRAHDARLVKKTGGVTLFEVAQRNGFSDERALFEAVDAARGKKDEIEMRARQALAEQEAIFRTEIDESIRPGDDAMHTEAQLLAIISEYKALANNIAQETGKNRGERVDPVAILDAAAEIIDQEQGRRAQSYYLYSKAEAREYRLARQALKAGKKEEALNHIRLQMLNHALVLKAIEARELIKKVKKDYATKALTTATKEIHNEYREAVITLAWIYNLQRSRTLMPASELAAEGRGGMAIPGAGDAHTQPDKQHLAPDLLWHQQTEEEAQAALESLTGTISDLIPDWLKQHLRPDGYKNVADLTVAQIKELQATMQLLIQRGKGELTTIKDAGAATVREAAQQTTDAMSKTPEKIMRDDRTRAGKAQRLVLAAAASMKSVEYLCKEMGGFMAKMWNTAHDLDVEYELRLRALKEQLAAPMKVLEGAKDRLAKLHGGPLFTIPGVTLEDKTGGRGRTQWDANMLIAFCLNMGNDKNVKAALGGYGLTDIQARQIMRQLDAKEWAAIQKVWNLINTLAPELDQTTYRMTNRHMTKEPALPLTVLTADGQVLDLPGGYYPLRYDGKISGRARLLDEVTMDGKQSHPGQAAKAKGGMLIARKEGDQGEAVVTLPPLLDVGAVLNTHIQETIRFITHAEFIQQVDSLIRYKDDEAGIDWRETFTDHYGEDMYRALHGWLAYVAVPERNIKGLFDRLAEKVRSLDTMAKLFFKVKSGIKQTMAALPLLHAMRRAGGKDSARYAAFGAWSIASAAREAGGVKSVIDEINRLSPMMRVRDAKTFDREARDALTALDAFSGSKWALPEWMPYVGGKKVRKEDITAAGAFFMTAFDKAVNYPIWWGAYHQALDQGLNGISAKADPAEQQRLAVQYADQIILAGQPDAMPSSQSGLMRAEGLVRSFTQFMSYTNKLGNRMAHHWKLHQEGKITTQALVEFVVMEMYLPELIMAAAAVAWAGGDDDDDTITTAAKVAGNSLIGSFELSLSPVPIVRNLGKRYGGAFEIPGAGAAEIVSAIPKAVDDPAGATWSMARWAGYITGIPATNFFDQGAQMWKQSRFNNKEGK